MNELKTKKTGLVLRAILFSLIYFLAVAGFIVYRWTELHYYISLGDLMFTLTSPIDGTATELYDEIFAFSLPYVLQAAVPWAFVTFILCQNKLRLEFELRFFRRRMLVSFSALRRIACAFTVLLLLFVLSYVVNSMKIPEYLRKMSQQTTLYEDFYIAPQDVEISAPQEKKNLLYIYLESMETSYASFEDGGFQAENYIPGLTALAQEHVSFSDKEALGGFVSPTGTTWTMGALLATHSGVPFAFQTGANNFERYQSFASNLTTMGDILAEEGYRQEFLCGSEARFGGRELFFTQHGGYDIFDYNTAIEKGYIPEDYYVWWGYEDEKLFDIAKDELLRLSQQEQPFSLTMLTVDSHHIRGYVCRLCQNDYDEQTANVIACTDRLLTAFIDWCKQQDFYENTVIVIAGDHPRMDTYLVKDLDYMSRTLYNCFINAVPQVPENTENRCFTTMDMFPTVLSALGYEIEGQRLGLGTNMFSGLPTLAEEKGLDWLRGELDKGSRYYIERFS